MFAFPSRQRGPQPWTNDELAELYRVVDILARAGLKIETDIGMSDDGDPWLVFCRADTGDVIAHFARIDGQFVAASVAVDQTYRGGNFRQIVDQMVQSQPLMLPLPSRGTSLFLHPAIILTAFVATALAHSNKAMAGDLFHAAEVKWDHQPGHDMAGVKHAKATWFESLQGFLQHPLGSSKTASQAESGETPGITLASLIAIAMTAIQPVVESLSLAGKTLVDDVDKFLALASVSVAHHDMTAIDMPVGDSLAISSDNPVVVLPNTAGDTADTGRKLPIDGTDGQKNIIDLARDSQHNTLMVTAQGQKALAVSDDAAHQAVPVANEAPTELAPILIVNAVLQKAQLPAATDSGAHPELAAANPPVINVSDVNPQALQLLTIHLDSGAIGSGDHVKDTPHAGDASLTTTSIVQNNSSSDALLGKVAATGDATATPVIVDTSSTHASTLTFVVAASASSGAQTGSSSLEISTSSGAAAVQAIGSFTLSGQHDITTPLNATSDLQAALVPFATGQSELKLVVFQATEVLPSVFQFSPGVIFVDEKYLSASHSLSNPGGSLVLDLADGGNVKLVGVATVEHVVA